RSRGLVRQSISSPSPGGAATAIWDEPRSSAAHRVIPVSPQGLLAGALAPGLKLPILRIPLALERTLRSCGARLLHAPATVLAVWLVFFWQRPRRRAGGAKVAEIRGKNTSAVESAARYFSDTTAMRSGSKFAGSPTAPSFRQNSRSTPGVPNAQRIPIFPGLR